MADEIQTEVRGAVLVITLNRPEVMNAINTALAQGLLAAIERLEQDPALAVGVLAANGRGFSSGMDLKAFSTDGTPIGMRHFIVEGARKPLIAAIEGFALAGGLELALSCDLLVAARGAKLGIPEVKVGLFAAAGALARLPQRLGFGLAMEMALTGEPISAGRAYDNGLVALLCEPGEATATAVELATRIAGNAPLAVNASKLLVRAAAGRSEEDFWALQAPVQEAVFSSADASEGSRAFVEKRRPTWSGA